MISALRKSVGIPAALAAGAVAMALLSAAPAAAQDADAVTEALRKGDLAEAKAQLGQAVKRNPADYDAVFSYASTLPPKEALKLADSVSRAAKLPGWVKARGLRFSGDHLFLKEDYKKAADAYLQASLLDNGSPMYKHLYALSIAMDGQTEMARVIWNSIALDKNNELSGEASRLLALLPKPVVTDTGAVKLPVIAPVNPQTNTPKQPAATPVVTDTGMVKLPIVAPVNPQTNTPKQPTVTPVVTDTGMVKLPVVAPVNQQTNTPKQPAATTVVTDTGMVKLPVVAPVNRQTNPVKVDSVKTPPKPVAAVASPTPVNLPVAPVNQQINPVKADSVKTPPKPVATVTPATPVSPPAALVNQQTNPVKADSVKAPPKPTGPAFTIQVGAFASKDNADNLVKRLTGKYDDITVSTTGIGDQTLYRVRVGTFQKKEDATAFADKLIIEAGLSARVTEK